MHQKKGKKILFYFILFLIVGSINNSALTKIQFEKIKNIQISGLNQNQNLNLLKSIKELNLKNLFFLNGSEISKIIVSNMRLSLRYLQIYGAYVVSGFHVKSLTSRMTSTSLSFLFWLARTAISSRPPCWAAAIAGKFPMLFLVPVNRSIRYKLPRRSVTNKCRSSRKSMPQGCDNGAPIFWINGTALAGIICPPNIVRAMMQRRISLPAK